MTIILSVHDYRKRRLPPVGYLDAAARRNDRDGVRHEHLARVLEARHAADRALPGSPTHVRAEPARDPGSALFDYYESHRWPALTLALGGMVLAAAILAAWIAL